jgi:hypothetical protein
MSKADHKINLRGIFGSLQGQMLARLQTGEATVLHPGTRGDATEAQWLNLFKEYLPQRYCAEKAFVLDCDGSLSDQIDIVIFDRQYSPLHLNQDGAVYVPAESVYAVFEVKPGLDGATVKYAGEKAASVRRLRRTSAPIPYAAGTYPPKPPTPIIAGILATRPGWNPPFGEPCQNALRSLPTEEQLDLGCVLEAGGFGYVVGVVEGSAPDVALVSFWLRLLESLQAIGTVVAVEFSQYRRSL